MPRPLLLPPGQRRRSACAADHLLAILVSTLPPCAAAAVLAVHRTFDRLELCKRNLQIIFKSAQRPAAVVQISSRFQGWTSEHGRTRTGDVPQIRRCVGRRFCYGFDSRPCATSRETKLYLHSRTTATVHQHADIDTQAGSAAAVESSSSHFNGMT